MRLHIVALLFFLLIIDLCKLQNQKQYQNLAMDANDSHSNPELVLPTHLTLYLNADLINKHLEDLTKSGIKLTNSNQAIILDTNNKGLYQNRSIGENNRLSLKQSSTYLWVYT